jgi:hypothetical protein
MLAPEGVVPCRAGGVDFALARHGVARFQFVQEGYQ